MRRLRLNSTIRKMVRETSVQTSDLIQPLFVVPGTNVRKPISSMPGVFNLSIDIAVEEAKRIRDLGIPATLLFAIPDYKDATGSSGWDEKGIIPTTVRAIKEQVPGLLVITDLCFCEYTDHGHCGILTKEGTVDNDATLDIILKQTLCHARAGADLIAPSGMIDGMIKVIRTGLDDEGFKDTPIMSYAAKFASGFYGPFREAAQCAPQFGDRKTYQMDPGNIEEALRETALDIEEGADMVMVKPAMAFLDVLRAVKERFQMPTAAYNVSGEYAMVKAAAEKGWIDHDRIMVELLYSIKRAGADMIITYFAEDYAKLAKGGAVEY